MKGLAFLLVCLSWQVSAGEKLAWEQMEALAHQFIPPRMLENAAKWMKNEYDYTCPDNYVAIAYRGGKMDPGDSFHLTMVDRNEPERFCIAGVGLATCSFGTRPVGFLELASPEKGKRYALIMYADFWVLIQSKDDGKTWEKLQDSGGRLSYVGGRDAYGAGWLSQADVDQDGLPEVIINMEGAPGDAPWAMFIYAWRNGKLELISPVAEVYTEASWCVDVPAFSSAMESKGSAVVLKDVDHDGKAEVVADPPMRDWDEEKDGSWEEYSGGGGPRCRSCVYDGAYRIFKLDSGKYKLWKEVPHTEPFPVEQPALAVFHPGTVSFSELESSQGLGRLRIFVSKPADGWLAGQKGPGIQAYDLASFKLEHNRKPLKFEKVWENKKFPDNSVANDVIAGVWLYQSILDPCGVWQVNPEQPAYPHQDPCRKYYFVGAYVEFSVRWEDVAPLILQQARKELERQAELKQLAAAAESAGVGVGGVNAPYGRGAEREGVFVEVGLLGSLKDGKLVYAPAMIAVKKDTSPQAPKAAGAAK